MPFRPKVPYGYPDNLCMFINTGTLTVLGSIVALIVLTLYIMRRRVRLGRRVGKF